MAADGVGRQGGSGAEAVGLLAANPLPLAEAAVEVLAGFELVVAVGEKRGAIAGVQEQFGDGVLLLGDRPQPGAPEKSPL